jgi:hypothetical protein
LGFNHRNVENTALSNGIDPSAARVGAPLGGTVCGGQYGLESSSLRPISPPNLDGGGGRYFLSIVVVAPGDPGVPVVCWAIAGTQASAIEVRVKSVAADAFTENTPAKDSPVEDRRMGGLRGAFLI